MKYTKLLTLLGLNKNEADLYLISLQLGPSTAIQLAQKVGVTRQMIYTLLPQLIEQGLMKETAHSSKRLFQAIGPEVLNDRVKNIADQVKEAVPILKTREAANSSVPILSVYENPISMREWYRRFMNEAKEGDQLFIWATNKTWLSADPDFLEEFLAFKKKNKIKDYILAPNTPESRAQAEKLKEEQPYAEYRFTDSWWHTNAEKWLWKDSVSYLTINENATNLIVLESKALAEIEYYNFRQIWHQLKP
ncbi:MAG: TrmB family transcriptional regulator [Candidatus Berkelbacteria bacterium Gr01-1014_85]|uniref:TrmB family transcriptional regulator n=1 Tax=Candidatus Berkelbacteria bacterium Gr01-1014_85 TaxID=2017150 RepID=A0A554JAT9_9BACT|nr:MAG: TrmB family transcriptional regulator [Candidatus Berkelbacteria bacterium Gr01-1014_85]